MEEDLGLGRDRARDRRGRAVRQSGHLQRQVVLIRPEPGNSVEGFRIAHHVGGRDIALFLGVAPGFEPDTAASIGCDRIGTAVARSEDVRIARPEMVIDCYAVFENEPRLCRKRRVGLGADTDHERIRVHPAAVGECYAHRRLVFSNCLNAHTTDDVDTFVVMTRL